jgi:competence protein ComEC
LSSDVSFQLSFLATFGVVCILPFLNKKFEKVSDYGGVKEILLTTLAAQVATLPVIIANFGQFSFLSFLANILILPTVPVLMVGGFALVAVSFVNLTLAQILSLPIYLILSYHLAVVNFLSSTDFGLIKF